MAETIKVTPEMADAAVNAVDWAAIDAMTDDDISRQVEENPDAALLFSDDEIERMQYGNHLRNTRTRLGLSQATFAERFRIPVGNVRDWEQGRSLPDLATRAYLTVIEVEPEVVARTLAAA